MEALILLIWLRILCYTEDVRYEVVQRLFIIITELNLCQVIDPINYHPLYVPNDIVDSHYVSLHLKKEGFLRIISK
jgi:hypothetical protein